MSPDGKWMWDGSVWIPAPPSIEPTVNVNLHDSVGDVQIIQNNAEDIASAMIQAMKHMRGGFVEDSRGNPSSSSISASPPPTRRNTSLQKNVTPQGPPATPLPQAFQQVRPAIADLDTERFREMMVAGGQGRHPDLSPEEFLTPVERMAQLTLSDPNQQLLTQYMN